MVRAAHALGKEFITITDHTRAAHYANGLDIDRLKRQWDEIAQVQEKVPQIRILRGSEVDILEDGALDWPDAILDQLDVVICSVHQRFKLDEPRQTERIRRALLHPKCGIWGHPTGRYLGDREPMPARWEELIALAAENGVTIECNGTPHRLDFSAELLQGGEQAQGEDLPLGGRPLHQGAGEPPLRGGHRAARLDGAVAGW